MYIKAQNVKKNKFFIKSFSIKKQAVHSFDSTACFYKEKGNPENNP